MGKMGRYCKAYPLARLREFKGWAEKAEAFREVETPEGDGADVAPDGDGRIVYLQESYAVTDGIFLDEHVIFDSVTPEWIDFCQNTLGFEIPVAELEDAAESPA